MVAAPLQLGRDRALEVEQVSLDLRPAIGGQLGADRGGRGIGPPPDVVAPVVREPEHSGYRPHRQRPGEDLDEIHRAAVGQSVGKFLGNIRDERLHPRECAGSESALHETSVLRVQWRIVEEQRRYVGKAVSPDFGDCFGDLRRRWRSA
jgi:hypothetical protein